MENDDIVFEKDEEFVKGKDVEETVKKLKEKIKKLESEKQEYLLGWQKARADFVNLRKKDEEDKQTFTKFANGDALTELIPILDSFEMAFANKEAWEKVDKNWRVGVEYIHNQLKTTMSRFGLSEIIPQIGEKFDVQTTEAVEHAETDDEKKDQTVARVIKKGYLFYDRLIRPAQVAVSEYKKSNE